MPVRNIQNYMSSGEATEIKVGGTGDEKSVVIHEDIAKVVTAPAYCFYQVAPDLKLTSTFQVIKGFNPIIVPVGVTYDNVTGNFTAVNSGIYQWDLERVYANHDKNPVAPVQLEINLILNDITTVFVRTGILGAATGPNEPNMYSATSPFIYEVPAGSKFKFVVKATMNGTEPVNTRLTLAQLRATKIHNL